LNQALSQRDAEKAARLESIATATMDLRKQLSTIWEACHIYEEDKSHFLPRFTSENFSEELYEHHRAELQVWKNYQKRNHALMEKVQSQDDLQTLLNVSNLNPMHLGCSSSADVEGYAGIGEQSRRPY